MITVSILINGQPIFTRTAVNQMEDNEKGQTKYLLDCGSIVWHKYKLGAIPLAIKMLKAIKEIK